MTYDYQILPTLDYCSFQGEILYEELNYQLLGIHGKVTPLHVSMEFEHGRIEPGRQDASVDGDIYLLDYTYFREEKAYELPDKFYIVVENKQKDWIECFHLFYREGNSYNLVKSVPGPKEKWMLVIFLPAATAAGRFFIWYTSFSFFLQEKRSVQRIKLYPGME